MTKLKDLYKTDKVLENWSFLTDADYRLLFQGCDVDDQSIKESIGIHQALGAWLEDSICHDEGYVLDRVVYIDGIYRGPETKSFTDGDSIVTSKLRQLVTNRAGQVFAITENSQYRLGRCADGARYVKLVAYAEGI